MRLRSMLLGSCVGVVSLAAVGPAYAAPGLYGNFFGGVSWGDDLRAITSSSQNSGSTTTFFNINGKSQLGFVVGVAIGYDLSDVLMKGLRVELEGSYHHNNQKGQFSSGTATSSSSTSATAPAASATTWALMANAWYDFDLGGKVKPYIGGGVGWARNKFTPKPFSGLPDAENEDFAWQLGAGVNYNFLPGGGIGLGYRYMDSGDTGQYTSPNGTVLSLGDVTHQDVILSLYFNLN